LNALHMSATFRNTTYDSWLSYSYVL